MLHFTLVFIFSSKNSSQFFLKPDVSQWLATNQIKETKTLILRILLRKEFKPKWYLSVAVLDRSMYKNSKSSLQIEVRYFQADLKNAWKHFQKDLFTPRKTAFFPNVAQGAKHDTSSQRQGPKPDTSSSCVNWKWSDKSSPVYWAQAEIIISTFQLAESVWNQAPCLRPLQSLLCLSEPLILSRNQQVIWHANNITL